MRHVTVAVVMVAVTALATGATRELHAQETTVDDVVEAWSSRQAATNTGEFRWIETVAGRRLPGDPRSGGAEKRHCILRIGDGANMRFESIGDANQAVPGDSLTRRGLAVSSFNGTRNAYYTAAEGPEDHHRGIQFEAEFYDEIVNYQLRALILCYRPMLVVRSVFTSRDSRIVAEPAKLSIVDRNATVNGTPCLLVESRPVNPSPVIGQYWVDMDRPGLILRYVEKAAGRASLELNIDYKDDAQDGWVPIGWSGSFLVDRIKATVVDYELNGAFPAGAFQIDYPAGTVVFDRDQSKQWRILVDGSREPITQQKAVGRQN